MARFSIFQGAAHKRLRDLHAAFTTELPPDDAIELRDLLMREFPVAADPSRERRERIATAVLAGMAANMNREQFTEAVLRLGDSHSRGAAATAIVWADALIAELDKE